VSDLGDLLVLLHGARARTSTVRATVRTWRHGRLMQEAFQRATRDKGGVMYAPGGEDEPEGAEGLVRVWLAPPDLAREERSGADGEGFGVRRGRLWWHYDPHNGARSNEDEPDIGGGVGEELWWLLDPAPVIGLLDFDAVVPGRCAGRATLHVRAVPRALPQGDDWPLMRLGAHGADELRLDVDAERGALLRLEARLEGRPFVISEVVEIAFDETFADNVFVFTRPPGEEVRSIADEFRIQRDLTVEQAAARAPFTVWIPSRLPAGWETAIAFAAENDRPPMAPHVHLHYRAADGTHTVVVAESPAGHAGEHSEYEHARPAPWREVERDGRRLQVREPAESWQPAQVLLELDGTRVHIHSSDLGADALVDFACSLVPAPSAPPSFGG
jgi:hypothetical protein